MTIPGRIVRFLEQSANVGFAGTRDRNLVPYGHRVSGWRVGADGRTLTALVAEHFTAHLVEALQDNGELALTVEEFLSHETYQFKGRYLRHRLLDDCADAPEHVLNAFVLAPALAVDFDVRFYLQDYLKVLDFGIVKDQPAGDESMMLSQLGLLQGTPAFMAPELVFSDRPIDGRADLYSLACSAYWAVTGQLLFEASTPAQMLLHHAQTPPVPPSQVSELPIPKQFETILMTCLEKDPGRRPSVLELDAQLDKES